MNLQQLHHFFTYLEVRLILDTFILQNYLTNIYFTLKIEQSKMNPFYLLYFSSDFLGKHSINRVCFILSLFSWYFRSFRS